MKATAGDVIFERFSHIQTYVLHYVVCIFFQSIHLKGNTEAWEELPDLVSR